jgi:hypothetical protein
VLIVLAAMGATLKSVAKSIGAGVSRPNAAPPQWGRRLRASRRYPGLGAFLPAEAAAMGATLKSVAKPGVGVPPGGATGAAMGATLKSVAKPACRGGLGVLPGMRRNGGDA